MSLLLRILLRILDRHTANDGSRLCACCKVMVAAGLVLQLGVLGVEVEWCTLTCRSNPELL